MNKIIIAITSFLMITSFATMASAEYQMSASPGAGITFAATNTTGPGVGYTPSPSTIIGAFTDATDGQAFTIIAASSKAAANAIEYGIISTDAGIYQRPIADTDDYEPAALTAADDLPGSGFELKGVTTTN